MTSAYKNSLKQTLKCELQKAADALLCAHTIEDELRPGDHDGANYCDCNMAVAYRKAIWKRMEI
jgi:hypothetical protein